MINSGTSIPFLTGFPGATSWLVFNKWHSNLASYKLIKAFFLATDFCKLVPVKSWKNLWAYFFKLLVLSHLGLHQRKKRFQKWMIQTYKFSNHLPIPRNLSTKTPPLLSILIPWKHGNKTDNTFPQNLLIASGGNPLLLNAVRVNNLGSSQSLKMTQKRIFSVQCIKYMWWMICTRDRRQWLLIKQ